MGAVATGLPLQKIDLIDLDRFAVSEQRYDDPEPHRCLCRRHNYDENRKDRTRHRIDKKLLGREQLAIELKISRERYQVQVDRVEYQLNRHEDDYYVAPRQHAGHPHDEE